MPRKKQEITAVLHLPKSKEAIRAFEKRLADFHVQQVQKKLMQLPMELRMPVLDKLLECYQPKAVENGIAI